MGSWDKKKRMGRIEGSMVKGNGRDREERRKEGWITRQRMERWESTKDGKGKQKDGRIGIEEGIVEQKDWERSGKGMN